VLLVLGVREGRQHVGQRCEHQVEITNIVLGKSNFEVPKFKSQGEQHSPRYDDTEYLLCVNLINSFIYKYCNVLCFL